LVISLTLDDLFGGTIWGIIQIAIAIIFVFGAFVIYRSQEKKQ
jgi:hypothetical protein